MKFLFQNLLSQLPIVILWYFSTVIISQQHVSAVSLPNNETVPAVIVFGDSIVDSGNNNYINTILKCNFQPYGRDFAGGNQPTGRFSNGLTPSDIIGTKNHYSCTMLPHATICISITEWTSEHVHLLIQFLNKFPFVFFSCKIWSQEDFTSLSWSKTATSRSPHRRQLCIRWLRIWSSNF